MITEAIPDKECESNRTATHARTEFILPSLLIPQSIPPLLNPRNALFGNWLRDGSGNPFWRLPPKRLESKARPDDRRDSPIPEKHLTMVSPTG